MQKVVKDGTLGISESDVFPESLKGSYCNGVRQNKENTDPELSDLENYYFE